MKTQALPRVRTLDQIAIAVGVGAACFALPLTAEATDYFVSNGGSDNASGLSGSPWQTLQRAWQSVQAGDTVTAEDGTYAGFACDSVSGTAVAPIVFKARNPVGAKINAPGAGVGSSASQDYIQLSSCSFITVDGFEVSGAPRSGIAILGNSDDGNDARGVIIQNCYSHDNGGTTVAGRHDGDLLRVRAEPDHPGQPHRHHRRARHLRFERRRQSFDPAQRRLQHRRELHPDQRRPQHGRRRADLQLADRGQHRPRLPRVGGLQPRWGDQGVARNNVILQRRQSRHHLVSGRRRRGVARQPDRQQHRL